MSLFAVSRRICLGLGWQKAEKLDAVGLCLSSTRTTGNPHLY